MGIASTALYGSFPGSVLYFESSCKCNGLKGPVKRCFGRTKPFLGLSGSFPIIYHNVAYDLESFETVRRSPVNSGRIDKSDHTLVYSQLVPYLYFSV